MLISDPNLANSNYTAILNEKYPQRKYLRHNLTSWLRCNKTKSRDISIKITNPEFKNKHSNLQLKKLSYNEEVNEIEVSKLEDALEIIGNLKLKVLEYEETNNKNIESSMKIIDELKAENEFYKKKLLENYEVLEKYEEKFGDKAVIGEYTNLSLMKFQKKFSAIKVFSILKNHLYRSRAFKISYGKFKEHCNFVLKIKTFLSLQKNEMIAKYTHKLEMKKYFQLYKTAFNCLKENLQLSKLTKKFFSIQNKIRLLFYFKVLRIDTARRSMDSFHVKKASGYYYSKKLRNVFDILKYNVYFNREKGLSRPKKVDKKLVNENKITFMKFLKETNTLELQPVLKDHKYKTLNVLKHVYDVIKMFKIRNLSNYQITTI